MMIILGISFRMDKSKQNLNHYYILIQSLGFLVPFHLECLRLWSCGCAANQSAFDLEIFFSCYPLGHPKTFALFSKRIPHQCLFFPRMTCPLTKCCCSITSIVSSWARMQQLYDYLLMRTSLPFPA